MSAIPVTAEAGAAQLVAIPLAPALGATITGVDLARPLARTTTDAIVDALLQRQVIFFHGRTLSRSELAAFARIFGEPHINPDTSFGRTGDTPEIEVLGYLFAHIRTPEYQCRFQRRTGCVAVWHNRVTQHDALADYTERRVMHRITSKGDRPF